MQLFEMSVLNLIELLIVLFLIHFISTIFLLPRIIASNSTYAHYHINKDDAQGISIKSGLRLLTVNFETLQIGQIAFGTGTKYKYIKGYIEDGYIRDNVIMLCINQFPHKSSMLSICRRDTQFNIYVYPQRLSDVPVGKRFYYNGTQYEKIETIITDSLGTKNVLKLTTNESGFIDHSNMVDIVA